MKRKTKKTRKQTSLTYKTFRYGKKSVRFVADKVIIFRLMRSLHGRFWGVTGLFIMTVFFSICFWIRPDMLTWSTAFSDFGRDVRTAPYLAAALFFAAYGLWRWRNYLQRTLKHSRPVTGLVTLTMLGLYIAALFPVAWEPWPYRIHFIGVIIFGASMAATVVVDTLLTRARRKRGFLLWRFLRLASFMLIIVGGYITFGSATTINWFQLALLGELMMFIGYAIWIIDKTYRGEGSRTRLSRIFRGLVLVD